jgi:hypothetical protein
MNQTAYQTVSVDGLSIFYREDAGHFALDEKAEEIAAITRAFLGRVVKA